MKYEFRYVELHFNSMDMHKPARKCCKIIVDHNELRYAIGRDTKCILIVWLWVQPHRNVNKKYVIK